MPERCIGLTWEPKIVIPSLKKSGSEVLLKLPQNLVWEPQSELIDGLFVPPNDPSKMNKLLQKQVKDTAGKGWFDMPAQTITPELKKDLQMIKVGTVVESASDFFSGRLTKKERKATLTDELLSDQSLREYRKRKVREIEDQNQTVGNQKWKIKGKQSWKRAKQRRHF